MSAALTGLPGSSMVAGGCWPLTWSPGGPATGRHTGEQGHRAAVAGAAGAILRFALAAPATLSHVLMLALTILDGPHYRSRPSLPGAETASDLLFRVGGTRFELVTSSVSGIISEPLTSRMSS